MSVLHLSKEAWLARKEQYKQRLSTIVIPLDITPGVAKGILARIDAFFHEIRLEYSELEEEKETVDSIVTEWERTKIVGTSDMLRKKSASEALQNYPLNDEGGTINLYEVQRTIHSRLSYMKGLISILDGKQSRLITASGFLKVEKDLIPHANIGMDAGS